MSSEQHYNPYHVPGGTPPETPGEHAPGGRFGTEAATTAAIGSVVEQKFREQYESNPLGMIGRYLELPAAHKNGALIISTDDAQELSEDYARDNESRAKLNNYVQATAHNIVVGAYKLELRREPPDGHERLVVFTGGGPGSGKSSGLKKPEMEEATKRAHIVFDTTMASNYTQPMIEEALRAHHSVLLAYTFRDAFLSYMEGVLPRAKEVGRTVSIDEHVERHAAANARINRLYDLYKNNPRVKFAWLDNSLGKGKTQIVPGPIKREYDVEGIKQRLRAAVEAEYRAGRISRTAYRRAIGATGEPRVSRPSVHNRGGLGGRIEAGGLRGIRPAEVGRPSPFVDGREGSRPILLSDRGGLWQHGSEYLVLRAGSGKIIARHATEALARLALAEELAEAGWGGGHAALGLELFYNPYHAPAGTEKGGEFTDEDSAGSVVEQDFGFVSADEDQRLIDKAGWKTTVRSEGRREILEHLRKVLGAKAPRSLFEVMKLSGLPTMQDPQVGALGIGYGMGKEPITFSMEVEPDWNQRAHGKPAPPDHLVMYFNHPEVHGTRTFFSDKRIEHNELFVTHRGEGLGTEILSRAITEYRKRGYERVELYAAGYPGDKAQNGYATWPKMGFDGQIPSMVDIFGKFARATGLSKAPNTIRDAKTVLDIIERPGGAKWWEENGTAFAAIFDLRDGSRSMRAFNAYLAARKAKQRKQSMTSHARAAFALFEEPDLAPWEMEALDEAVAENAREKHAWNEADHPREPEGTATGGEFAPKGSGRMGWPSPWKSPDEVSAAVEAGATAGREAIASGKVPLVRLGDPAKVGSLVVAQYQPDDGTVKVFPGFFEGDDFGRRVLLTHEFGHEVAARALSGAEDATMDVLRPFRKNPKDAFSYDNFAGLSSRPEEMLADVYSELVMSNHQPWEDEGKYADVYRHVLKIAKNAGLPMPKWLALAEKHFNPYHQPKGTDKGGEFTNAETAGFPARGWINATPPENRAAILAWAKKAFGDKAPENMLEVAELLGLPKDPSGDPVIIGAKLEKGLRGGTRLTLSFRSENIEGVRSFGAGPPPEAQHRFIEIQETGTGLGTDIFARSLREYEKRGIREIKLLAAGEADGMYNGYYTWARLGFNGDIPDEVREILPDKWAHVRDVIDLMERGGGDWWNQHGQEFSGRFDVRKGSRSRRAFDRYLKSRFLRKGERYPHSSEPHSDEEEFAAGPKKERVEEIDLADWEEEALDEAWDQIVKEREAERDEEPEREQHDAVSGEQGRWVTIRGNPVYIEDGIITKGPSALVGLEPRSAKRKFVRPPESEPTSKKSGPAPSSSADTEERGRVERAAAKFKAEFEADPAAMVKRYFDHPEARKNGSYVISADIAKDLSKEYSESNESRTLLAAAVHPTSQAIARAAWDYAIALSPEKGHDRVVAFTAGGPGAGKSTGIKNFPHLQKTTQRAHIIYDATMSIRDQSLVHIQAALAAGFGATVIHTYRNPVDAYLNGVISRAVESGRIVPAGSAMVSHSKSNRTIRELQEALKDDKRVKFRFIDNSLGFGKAKLLSRTRKGMAFNVHAAQEQVREAVEAKHAAGKISDLVRRFALQGLKAPTGRGRTGPSGRHVRGGHGGRLEYAGRLTIGLAALLERHGDTPGHKFHGNQYKKVPVDPKAAPPPKERHDLDPKIVEPTEAEARGVAIGKKHPHDCYRQAAQYVIDHGGILREKGGENPVLIHGLVESAAGWQTSHAWAEINGKVWDGTVGQFFDKDDYYAKFKVQIEKTYTPTETRRMMVKTRVWGPWHETAGAYRDKDGGLVLPKALRDQMQVAWKQFQAAQEAGLIPGGPTVIGRTPPPEPAPAATPPPPEPPKSPNPLQPIGLRKPRGIGRVDEPLADAVRARLRAEKIRRHREGIKARREAARQRLLRKKRLAGGGPEMGGEP